MKIPIGIDKNTSKVVLIEDLTEEQRGLKSNCICPECKSDLVARMGEKTIKHFAHYRGNESESCQETALHLLGKYVLSQLKSIELVDYETSQQQKKDLLGRDYYSSSTILFGSNKVGLLSSELEKSIGNIRADVLSKVDYEGLISDFNFEVKVWHRVDDHKEKKLQDLNVNTIEIDISNLLSENVVNFEKVKQELNQPYNQKIIHLNDSFLDQINNNVITRLNNEVEQANSKILNWIKIVNTELQVNGYQLPSYSFEFKSIPKNKFGEMICSKLPEKPKLNSYIKIAEFKHVDALLFELTAVTYQGTKSLSVLLDENYENKISELELQDDNFLVMDIANLECDVADFKVKWGKNKIAETYKTKCQEIIDKAFEERRVYDEKQLFKNLEETHRLIESSQIRVNRNYQKIKNLSLNYFKEMIKKGVEEDYLKLLICEEVDPHRIFGCQPRIWQMILIRDIFWVNNDGVDVKFSMQRLEKMGVDLVDPYRQLMFKSKLLKEKSIEMPFRTPYKMLMDYFSYLKMRGFLAGGLGSRYKKGHIFGDTYKQMTKGVVHG